MAVELVPADGAVLRTIAEAAEEHLGMALQGSCAGHPDPGLWHRDDKSDPEYSAEDTRSAVAICQGCPVRKWCEGTFDTEPHGVFGGRTATSRAERRSRAKDAAGTRERDRERLRLWRERKRAEVREGACSPAGSASRE